MIDSKDFSKMKEEFKRLDLEREKIILLSRDIIRLSKQIIYSVHRDDMKEAESVAKRIKEDVNSGDMTAIDGLLALVPKKYLEGFL